MIDIQINDNLLRLVENKRVIILGPAPYLVGSGAAKEIDDYDVVCRVNDIIPPLSLRPDYGNRTDIMFHNFGTPWMAGLTSIRLTSEVGLVVGRQSVARSAPVRACAHSPWTLITPFGRW